MPTAICWAVLAAIHLMPALALFRPSLIARLYAVEPASTSYLLLHNRAALFAGVLVACLWAMVRPEPRPLATVVAAISMISFLWLWWQTGAPPALRTIAIADAIDLPFLAFVAWQAFRPR